MSAKSLMGSHAFSLSLNAWRWFYLLLAFLIAIKVMANQHGWVNNDSLLYFEQARLIAAQEWSAAFQLFQWPFYAGLIAVIHIVSGLEIQASAQCLNVICFVLFVAGFQQLLLAAGAKARTFHWGIWLLFSTSYIVGDILGMLLRDEGFWAAYTWGLVYWCRYTTSHQQKNALLFQACMVIAILFRIEAFAYLVAIPLIILIEPSLSFDQKLRRWLTSNSLIITITAVLAIAMLTGAIHYQQLGRLQEVFSQLSGLLTDRLSVINQKAEVLGQQVLGNLLDDYASISLWSSLLLIILLKTAKVAGYPTLLLLLWPRHQWWSSLSRPMQKLAPLLLITGFIVSTVIILNAFVLSSRYVIASGIVMLCLAAFAITHCERYWPRWTVRLFVLIIASMTINNVWDHSTIDLDRESVNAIVKINQQHSRVFYDTENARFYAGQPFMNRIDGYTLLKQVAESGRVMDYDIYVITPHRDMPEYEPYATTLMQTHHFVLKETLYGWRKKSKAYIYIRQQAMPDTAKE